MAVLHLRVVSTSGISNSFNKLTIHTQLPSYSFVTLSTIGFGDFIPTFQPHQEREFGIYFQLYQGFVLLWFVFGLSYILMLIGFIARGMRSKRIARLENQLAENIKLTHQRIWHGVGKDVGYLRKILHEVYLMRFRVSIYYYTLIQTYRLVHFSSSFDCSQHTMNQLLYGVVLNMLVHCLVPIWLKA